MKLLIFLSLCLGFLSTKAYSFNSSPYSSEALKAIEQLKRDLKDYKLQSKAESFTREDLKRIAQKKSVRSVADFLAHIPKNYFKQIIMIKPRALQQGSIKYPRVILFSPSSDLIFSFNGHPSHAGYGSIEILDFDWDSFEFKLGQINFDKDMKLREEWLKKERAKYNKQSEEFIELSKALRTHYTIKSQDSENPQVCMGCHKATFNVQTKKFQDPQPNWDHYPIWPGALPDADVPGFEGLDPVIGGEFTPLDSLQISGIKADLTQRLKGHPRYKYITFSEKQDFNSEFTQRIFFLNILRAYRRVLQNPDFENLILKLIRAVNECEIPIPEDLNKYQTSQGGYTQSMLQMRKFLRKNSLSIRLLNLNFLLGDGNQMTMPGDFRRTLYWVFLRDVPSAVKGNKLGRFRGVPQYIRSFDCETNSSAAPSYPEEDIDY